MWSVGGDVKFIPATTCAKKGLEKGLSRAMAAQKLVPSSDQRWAAPAARDDEEGKKSRWVVDEAPYVEPSQRKMASHLALESRVLDAGNMGGGGNRAATESDSDSSSYGERSESEESGERGGRGGKRGVKRRQGMEGGEGGSESRDDDGGGRAERKRARKKESRKESKKKAKKEAKEAKKKSSKSSAKKSSKKSKKRRDSDSDADSDSDPGAVSFVSGKKIKLKLEGTSKKDEQEEKRRQAYLRCLNAQIETNEILFNK